MVDQPATISLPLIAWINGNVLEMQVVPTGIEQDVATQPLLRLHDLDPPQGYRSSEIRHHWRWLLADPYDIFVVG